MHVLELNDAELTLSREGEVLWREPGAVSLAQAEPLFGDAALAASRLHPRHTHSQHFGRMNADPVTPSAPGIANQADLVYRHLRRMKAAASLGDAEPLHVLVHGPWAPEQLALLLGIAEEARVKVVGFIDAAVAALADTPWTGDVQVIELGLHRATVTTLTVAEAVCQQRTEDVAEAGLLRLIEGWVDAVADRFVAETRFGPLRVAATEQQVFDQVYAAVAAGAGAAGSGELTVETEHRGVARTVTLPWSALRDKSAQRYERLAQRVVAPAVAVTHRAARLPAFTGFLTARKHEVCALAQDAASDNARTAAAAATAADGGVRFVTELPRRRSAPDAASAPAGTHLLCGAIAVPLGEAFAAAQHPQAGGAFRIVRRAGGYHVLPDDGATVTVDGHPVTDAAPVPLGAAIACAGREFRIVRVVEA